MNYKQLSIVLFLSLLAISINACKEESQKKYTTETSKIPTETKNSLPNDLTQSEEQPTIPTYFESPLRPKVKLQLGKIYTDTVSYESENRWDADEALFFVKKGQQEIIFIDQRNRYPFCFMDEKLIIQWKIDSLRPAGDPDFLDFTEFLISAKRADSIPLTSKKMKVLWRENRFSPMYNDTINTIILNPDYLQSMSMPERAALGYVATFIGNECEWDGEITDTRTNLKCVLMTYLDLGYQCSEKHLGFLNQWFATDTVSLQKLKKCPTIPDGATIQTTFDAIDIETNLETKTITLHYKTSYINLRENERHKYQQTDVFHCKNNQLILIKSEKIEMED